MGLRFHRIFNVLPGVRVNLSKSGLSTSVGPRGADVNIGRQGVTTNASLPGTGLSYRSKMGSKSSKIGVLTLIGGLAFAGYKNADKIINFFHPSAANHAAVASHTLSAAVTTAQSVVTAAKPANGVRYVNRTGSDLRDQPKTTGKVLKKEARGQQVQLIAISGVWAQVQDGPLTGWMRASVLKATRPE
jgi:hypothetical protein